MNTSIISCRQAKQIDMVDYLTSLGHHPRKILGNDYWYLSPLRDEKTPSFKVHRKLNVWYDHGVGKGGNLVDFGILYYRCSVSEFLQKLSDPSFFQQQKNVPGPALTEEKYRAAGNAAFARSSGNSTADDEDGSHAEKSRIKILSEKEIQAPGLIHYLLARQIPVDAAREHCRQVDFELYGKKITALGFPNQSGGFELRNPHFKGSSSPKDVSLIDNRTEEIAVFEGFFSFLSFKVVNIHHQAPLTNCLILNSLSFLEKSRPLMEKYAQVFLLLDNDMAGKKATTQALGWSDRYIDRSVFYTHHKDLNDWLRSQEQQPRQSHQQTRRR